MVEVAMCKVCVTAVLDTDSNFFGGEDVMILMVFGWTAVISLALSYVYFCYRVMEAKISKKKQMVAIATFILTICFLFPIETLLLRVVLACISIFVFMYLVFEGTKIQFLMWTFFAFYVSALADTLIYGLYLLLPLDEYALLMFFVDRGFNFYEAVFLYAIVLFHFVVFHLISRNFNKNYIIYTKELFCLSAIGISLYPLVVWIFSNFNVLSIDMFQSLFLIVSASMLVILVSTFTLYNHMIQKAEERLYLQLESKTYQLTKEHTAQIIDTYGKITALKHDVKNHFTAILGYLENNDTEKAKEYVAKLSQSNSGDAIYSKNPVLNALLSAKVQEAEEENIKFTIDIVLPSPLPVSDIDLCILVGNLLDNAFEARPQGEQGHYVDLNIKVVDAYCLISCTNKAYTADSFTVFNNLKSTKTINSEVHGIGTKQIQRIAEETGGYVRYKNENGEFQALVMLKL